MIGLTMILMSALIAQNFIVFLCFFSVGFGITNGLTYMVPMTHGWLWFPNSPGLVSGIIIGGFGIGTFAFGQICTAIVNPDNAKSVNGKFPDEVNKQVPKMLLVFTLSMISIVIVSLFLIFPGHDPTSQKEVKEAIAISVSQALTSSQEAN